MVFLRFVKGGKGRNLGNNWPVIDLIVGKGLYICFYCFFLLLVLVESYRPVLGASVRTLPVKTCRVVRSEENLDQLKIADLLRVVVDFNSLGMGGSAIGDLLISWVFFSTTCIA